MMSPCLQCVTYNSRRLISWINQCMCVSVVDTEHILTHIVVMQLSWCSGWTQVSIISASQLSVSVYSWEVSCALYSLWCILTFCTHASIRDCVCCLVVNITELRFGDISSPVFFIRSGIILAGGFPILFPVFPYFLPVFGLFFFHLPFVSFFPNPAQNLFSIALHTASSAAWSLFRY